MMKKILLIVAPEGFRDEEALVPKQAFQDQGFHVDVGSVGVHIAQGKLGAQLAVDKDLVSLSIEAYDCIAITGGPGAVMLREHPCMHELLQSAYKQGKLLAAICLGPTILAKAGVLSGKQATVWNGNGQEAKRLEEGGATFVDKDVVIDELLITGNGPDASAAWANAIINALA
ncbi:MAG: DJ-1/PfpI family protein [Candidatus Woesearchaeota archaeon]|nr:MAG: DJ-1/PfpI family protein [Candidatus Woesearchaeota archaeon]